MTREKSGDTSILIEGDGPPVILVHGMGLNLQMWDWQMPRLRDRFRVIRYDLLGHGDSDKPVKRYDMADLVDQLGRVMDADGLDRAAIVGFSLGGLIVRAFALAHPDRVTALAILNSAHARNETERAGMMERLALATREGHLATVEPAIRRWFTEDFIVRHPEIIDQVRRWMADNDSEVYPLVYRVLAEGDGPLARSITAIRCPTLVLACEDDAGNSPDMARRMAALIPDACAAIVPGLKHMGLVEKPEAISDILVPFLTSAIGSN